MSAGMLTVGFGACHDVFRSTRVTYYGGEDGSRQTRPASDNQNHRQQPLPCKDFETIHKGRTVEVRYLPRELFSQHVTSTKAQA